MTNFHVKEKNFHSLLAIFHPRAYLTAYFSFIFTSHDKNASSSSSLTHLVSSFSAHNAIELKSYLNTYKCVFLFMLKTTMVLTCELVRRQ
jgi:hypothetical protein